MEPKFFELPVHRGDVNLRVARGHFATPNSHVNYLIDVTVQKTSLTQAQATARQLAERLQGRFLVDSILCLDGTRVIGTCLARELSQGGYRSLNEGREIYVLRGESNSNGQFIFLDNTRYMVDGKNVLLLLSSVTTGRTAAQSMESIRYYGGRVAGIAALYSAVDEAGGVPVEAVFRLSDLPGYESHDSRCCPLCRQGVPLDALVNSYGYSKL